MTYLVSLEGEKTPITLARSVCCVAKHATNIEHCCMKFYIEGVFRTFQRRIILKSDTFHDIDIHFFAPQRVHDFVNIYQRWKLLELKLDRKLKHALFAQLLCFTCTVKENRAKKA